ncbi:MAG: PhoH family protein [Candidatus Eremiobacteraeota bacterium]|nr:PhoH family protein [Candidatus Eremiobacteraeota bacterium]
MSKKTYIVDTSVLLHTPDSLFTFEENTVVIPIVVLDEIDKFKKGSMEVNRNARIVIKTIDQLREKGRLTDGVPLNHHGMLRVETDFNSAELDGLLPEGFQKSNDNRILAHALSIKNRSQDPAILVTKDINMRVKAEAIGLEAEDYRADKVNLEELFSGHRELFVTEGEVSEFYRNKVLTKGDAGLFPNEYVTLVNSQNPSNTALARYDSEKRALVALMPERKMEVWGLHPRNREQRFAMDMLLNDSIQLVTLLGRAGTGKTLLALAAGLQKVVNEKTYRKLNVYRPLVPMGRDIGYLPGREEEKINPWMHPIHDNLEFLLHDDEKEGKKDGAGSTVGYLLDSQQLDIKALTFIRGRSLPFQIILVDESQNLTPHEAKTIITRAGEGTKIILTGDAYQIDHPYLDSTSNGLTHIIERFKDQKVAGHITLVKGERSPLAELASIILE